MCSELAIIFYTIHFQTDPSCLRYILIMHKAHKDITDYYYIGISIYYILILKLYKPTKNMNLCLYNVM